MSQLSFLSTFFSFRYLNSTTQIVRPSSSIGSATKSASAKPEVPVAMPEPLVVPETDLATVAYRQVVAAAEARYAAAPDTTGKALWTRAAEKTMIVSHPLAKGGFRYLLVNL